MSDVKWVKLSTGMFSESRKIKQIEQMPEGDTILVIWIKLITLAGQINDGGAVYITPEIPYTEEMLAYELRRPAAIVKIALSVFERFGMLQNKGGFLYLTSWEKYQSVEKLTNLREYNRLAKQKSRTKQKMLLTESTNVNDMSLTCQRGQDIEKEIEIEEEKETEKESMKEIHSYAHSLFESSENEKPPPESAEEAARHRRQKLGGSLGRGVVMLSEEQMDALLEVLSAEEFDHYVSVIAENELKGNHYKKRTHYQAILDMAKVDRKI